MLKILYETSRHAVIYTVNVVYNYLYTVLFFCLLEKLEAGSESGPVIFKPLTGLS